MDALPSILESMRLSLVAIVALAAFGFTGVSLMLFRQSQVLRDHGQMLRDSQGLLRDSEALVRETHALTAKAVAALENVSRLVVHPGKRPPDQR